MNWHALIPKRSFTYAAGILANSKVSWLKNQLIRRFISKYPVNMQEALEENPYAYKTFNEFFTRHLKLSLRPISSASIISPVDGYLGEFGNINKGTLIQAKGQSYEVSALLNLPEISPFFERGSFITFYLSPSDYHRVHMPLDGTLHRTCYSPGKLNSVNPSFTIRIPNLFARNERLSVLFNNEQGQFVMVLVGAVIVGNIGTVWSGDLPRATQCVSSDYLNRALFLKKGSEMGYFKLGSTVILLFDEHYQIDWRTGLRAGDRIHLGEALVNIVKEVT